jgi:hypothetical protein
MEERRELKKKIAFVHMLFLRDENADKLSRVLADKPLMLTAFKLNEAMRR